MANPFVQRITQLFNRTRTKQVVVSTADEKPRALSVTGAEVDFAEMFRVTTGREAVIRTSRGMYEADPRAKRVISELARDMVKGGFTVGVPGNRRAEESAAALIERTKLSKHLDDWIRLNLRDGDTFLELGLSNALEIVEATRKPTLQMFRHSNQADHFADAAKAFYWSDQIWLSGKPGDDVIWFAEWQIIHARFDHDEGERYGRPLFAPTTSAHKRLREGEFDVAVRRKTRSGLKYLHVVEGASESELNDYKERNKDALGNAFAAVADFFTNKAGSVSAIQGDANLEQIADVVHHIRTWFVASPIPMSLLGYGQDLNRDVLEEQKEQYERALETLTQWVEDEYIKPLLERQWLLDGLWPEGLAYEIRWKAKQPLTAKVLKDVADALTRLRALHVPDAIIVAILEKFMPGMDFSAMLLSGEAERIANAAEGL